LYYYIPACVLALAMSICTSTQNSQIISSCSECAKSSRSGFLRKYFVNLEETIVTCDNEKVSLSEYTVSALNSVVIAKF